jgi:hypothetical protein
LRVRIAVFAPDEDFGRHALYAQPVELALINSNILHTNVPLEKRSAPEACRVNAARISIKLLGNVIEGRGPG